MKYRIDKQETIARRMKCTKFGRRKDSLLSKAHKLTELNTDVYVVLRREGRYHVYTSLGREWAPSLDVIRHETYPLPIVKTPEHFREKSEQRSRKSATATMTNQGERGRDESPGACLMEETGEKKGVESARPAGDVVEAS
ncbi:MAG: hypothetical protein M1828_007018 [Chrysothrix sp. TS-e1954]|nr:MAG: hypothetical protein M1828_007018 [Chrysothrix sp. TS-e1954]